MQQTWWFIRILSWRALSFVDLYCRYRGVETRLEVRGNNGAKVNEITKILRQFNSSFQKIIPCIYFSDQVTVLKEEME